MSANVRVEWLRRDAANPNGLDGGDAWLAFGAIDLIVTGAAPQLTAAAPIFGAVAFGAAAAVNHGLARITVIGGAVIAAAGANPVVAEGAGMRLAAGDRVDLRVLTGDRLAFVEAVVAGRKVPGGAVVVTPGTPVAPGVRADVNCTAAGNLRLVWADGSTTDYAVNQGVSIIDGAFTGVDAAHTTAVCVVSIAT